jgi:hypothetical protein
VASEEALLKVAWILLENIVGDPDPYPDPVGQKWPKDIEKKK